MKKSFALCTAAIILLNFAACSEEAAVIAEKARDNLAYSGNSVFEAAEMSGEEITEFVVWKGSPYREGAVCSETFFTKDEGTPKAAGELAEKLGGLELRKIKYVSRFDKGSENYCVITAGGIVRFGFYFDGENAEINVWNTVTGSTRSFDIDTACYEEIAALAEELVSYKTPVTYDDMIIRDAVSKDYAAVRVNTQIVSNDLFTEETAGSLMELLRKCEYTPLPDDIEEGFCPAEFYLYKTEGDTEPLTLRLSCPTRNHSTESYNAVSVKADGREYFYAVDRDKWQEIYRLTDWGPGYVI